MDLALQSVPRPSVLRPLTFRIAFCPGSAASEHQIQCSIEGGLVRIAIDGGKHIDIRPEFAPSLSAELIKKSAIRAIGAVEVYVNERATLKLSQFAALALARKLYEWARVALIAGKRTRSHE